MRLFFLTLISVAASAVCDATPTLARLYPIEAGAVEVDLSKAKFKIEMVEASHYLDDEPLYSNVEDALRAQDEVDPKIGMLPAAWLAQKAKQTNDDVYATLELAAQDGLGSFTGKSILLRELSAALEQIEASAGTAIIAAAARLGGQDTKFSQSLEALVQSEIARFDADHKQTGKPIGFYTGS